MINTDREPLLNECNEAISQSVKQYFLKYPNSSAKECCRQLRLDYRAYGGRARKIKHDLKIWKRSETTVTDQHGRSLKPHIATHRLEYRLKAPCSFVLALNNAAEPWKTWHRWYRSANRNKQIEYCDEHVSIRLHQNGTCRILQRQKMTFEELRVHVEDAFSQSLLSQSLLSDAFTRMMACLQVSERHRTFRVGPLSPFKVNYYRDSLGLDILADGSHPEHLEVHETWPTWLSPLLEHHRSQSLAIGENTKVVGEFASQIQSHLHVMKGIGLAVERLNEATRNLTETIDRKLGRADKKNHSSSDTETEEASGSR